MITNDNPHSLTIAGGSIRICYWKRGDSSSTASDREEASHVEVELAGNYVKLELPREPNKINPWCELDKLVTMFTGAFERGKVIKLKEVRDFLGIKERGIF